MNKGKRLVRLTMKKKFVLAEWIRRNHGRIEEERPTHEDAAKWAAVDLGFEVNAYSIFSVHMAMEETWIWPVSKGSTKQVRKHPKRHLALCADVAKLQAAVEKISNELGVSVDL
jgi:hypothetical protein